MVELEFAQALEAPTQVFSYNCSLDIDIAEEVVSPHKICGQASVLLKYFIDYDSVLHLTGSVRIPCKFVCDRCGSSFEKNLFLELDEKISPDINDEQELSYDMPKLVLDDIINSFVLLNFPTKVLCKENCLGLCSNCGANLNDGECDCSKNKIGKNNPFADLLNSRILGGKD